jgi:hypothetical protein
LPVFQLFFFVLAVLRQESRTVCHHQPKSKRRFKGMNMVAVEEYQEIYDSAVGINGGSGA